MPLTKNQWNDFPFSCILLLVNHSQGAVLLDESEESLVKRCKAGDSEAFRSLIDLHHRVIFGTAFLMMSDRSSAEDAVQEALIKMWKNFPSLRAQTSVKSWLVRIVVNQVKQQHRKKRLPTIPLDNVPEITGDPDTTEMAAIQNKNKKLIRMALGMLPPEQKEVVVLRYFSELTVPEIARVMGKSEGTIKSRLSRALDKLAVILRCEKAGEEEKLALWKK
jgi:RNA polymerase sigma-70 factor, ECF subfamily